MRSFRKGPLVAVLALAAALTLGAAVASAHGGPGNGNGLGQRGLAVGSLVTEAAKQLDVTRAKLREAVVESAHSSVDEAGEDEEIDADEAAELKEEASDNLRVAYRLSRTRTVAANLDVSTAKLNSAFRAARKVLLLAKIDRAVADGDLTEEEAAARKQRLENATLPGYKPAGRGFGLGPGCGGERERGR